MSSVLERARAGDQVAFAALVEPHRRELHVHCYRMLGSITDADDLLQETMTAAWRGLPGFTGHSSLRTWMYRIATRRCLNAIRDAKRRPPTVPVPPFSPPDPSRRGDITWLQPYPDAWLNQLPACGRGPSERYQARETVELAFITALQRLPARQTAAVVLCDVLDFPAAEAASMLDVTPTAVKGLLQRGRAALTQTRLAEAQQSPPPGTQAERALAHRFADAFMVDDIDRLIALLTDDAWLAMPPAPQEYHGLDAIAAFLDARTTWRPGQYFRLLFTRVNGRPAFGCYLVGEPTGVLALTFRCDRIDTITHFLDPGLPALIGLPSTYPDTAAPA